MSFEFIDLSEHIAKVVTKNFAPFLIDHFRGYVRTDNIKHIRKKIGVFRFFYA